MARIRTIKPEFWSSPDVADASRDARLFFIALWNFADDDGRIEYIPQQLASAVFPFDDDVTGDTVTQLTQELVDATLVRPYQISRRRYLYITGWQHQRINRPSSARCPDPDDSRATPFSPNPHAQLTEPSTDPISPKKERRSVGALERRSEVHVSSTEDTHTSDDATQQFDEHFWPAYPARGGKKRSKAKALAQWRKLTRDERRRAYTGARHYAESGEGPMDAHRFLTRQAGEWPFDDWQTPAEARASPNGQIRLTAAEQRTQRNRENITKALAKQDEMGLP
jgi:hypothetical protein